MPAETCVMFALSLQQTLWVVPLHVSTTSNSSSHTKFVLFKKSLVSLKSPEKHFSLIWQWVENACKYLYLYVTDRLWINQRLYMPHSQESRGWSWKDCTGLLTGPVCPVHCPPKGWFRCRLTMWRKWSSTPSFLLLMKTHILQENWKTARTDQCYIAPISLICETTCPKDWFPAVDKY